LPEEEEEADRENNDPHANSSVCMHGIRAWVKAAGLFVVMRERSDSEKLLRFTYKLLLHKLPPGLSTKF